ncbi:MAG TPA: cytochrome b [Usitatibacter sp.]|nr:cytochrome b [Usitatibacter sp.]
MREENRYTTVAIVLHWLIAALVVAQFAFGWWMQEIPKSPPGLRAGAFNLHKSIGLTILALMLVRLAWRLAHRPPALTAMPRWQANLARATHIGLYVLLIALPLTGYIGSSFSGYPVKLFGMPLPAWAPKNEAVKDWMSAAHLAIGWALAVAFTLHVAGALKHALLDHDGVLRRMGFSRD